MKKWLSYISFGAILVLTLSFFNPIRAAIQQIAGLAVAQSSTKWNNIKDAIVGDSLTNGLPATALYEFDGTNWDRVRGDSTYGLDVDVTRIPAIVGAKTPADAYANLTDALGTWSLLGLWNGTTWDRAKKAQQTMANSMAVVIASDQSAINVTATTPVSGTAFYAVKRADIAAVSVNFVFGFTSKKVVIETAATNTDEVCIDWIGGTAVCPAANTAGDDRVAAGRSITLDDYAVTSISVISSSGTQTISVRAFN